MKNINEIMQMLDWNNSIELQKEGVALGKKYADISYFLQPSYDKFDKNVWDNCALIIASKSDEQLLSYTRQLLEWVEDLNWPGALTILKRLKRFPSEKHFISTLEEVVEIAYAS